MNRHTIPLGRIRGIPIGLDPSWFLVFILVTWTLATSYFPGEFTNWPRAQYWIVAAVTAILFFASIVLHELGHSIVALRYKVPVRSITLYLFGGVAQIETEPPSAGAEFWIAIAGPAVSLALAGLFRLLESAVGGLAPALALSRYLAYINGSVALFNLIPGFPLDGGRVFRAVVWSFTQNLRRATMIAATLGRGIGFLFILFGAWQLLTGNVGNGLWIAFIGWFLENAASAQIWQQQVASLLAGHKVSEAMSRSCVTVPAETTIQQLIDRHILGQGQRCMVVARGGEAVGLLTLHHIREVSRENWATVTAGEAMTPLGQVKWVLPEEELQQALGEMDRDGVNQLPVMEGSSVLGMLSREDVISYLRTLQMLRA
jgi:Zn-dependent protease/CBS domain-containing protein